MMSRYPQAEPVRTPTEARQSEARVAENSQPARPPDTRGSTASMKRTRRPATFTSTPDTAAPQLLCPTCDRPLVYRQTVISGVKPIERWDYFECKSCGPFVYRDRTRKLRRNG